MNVAVPDVMGAFGIGQDQAQLMATAFNVSMTASQLLNAWVVAVLSQRYGFAAALIIYTCGSLIGGFSQDFNMIVLGRVLQGIASGIIQPLILVTIFQVFPHERRGFAAGVYSMAFLLAVARGPVFGGLAMEVLDWRYIFIAPLPVIGIAFVAGMFVLPSNRKNRTGPSIGPAMASWSSPCSVYDRADRRTARGLDVRLHPRLVHDFDLVGGCLHLFAIQIRRADHGDVALRNREFAWAMGSPSFSVSATSRWPMRCPSLGSWCKAAPLDAGLVLLPSGVVVVALLPFMGRLADRMKAHYAIIAGLLLFAIGTIPMGDADVNTVFIAIVIYGIINRLGISLTQPFI